jgi:hypothetical protein
VSLAADAITAARGVLFLGSPIPKLITASPRSRSSRASSFNAKVGDRVISLASLLNFMSTPEEFHVQSRSAAMEFVLEQKNLG